MEVKKREPFIIDRKLSLLRKLPYKYQFDKIFNFQTIYLSNHP